MKKGYTLIEVLITTVLIGMFLLCSFPIFNGINNKFNELTQEQLAYLNKIKLYKAIEKMNYTNNDIYYQQSDKLVISIGKNKIDIKDSLILINGDDLGAKFIDAIIQNNLIILKISFNNSIDILVLKGKVYEMC